MEDTGHDIQSSSSSDHDDEMCMETEEEPSASSSVRQEPSASSSVVSEIVQHFSPPPDDSTRSSSPPSSSPPQGLPLQDPWFPFLSKPHMQLCLLYHGSHRYSPTFTFKCLAIPLFIAERTLTR